MRPYKSAIFKITILLFCINTFVFAAKTNANGKNILKLAKNSPEYQSILYSDEAAKASVLDMRLMRPFQADLMYMEDGLTVDFAQPIRFPTKAYLEYQTRNFESEISRLKNARQRQEFLTEVIKNILELDFERQSFLQAQKKLDKILELKAQVQSLVGAGTLDTADFSKIKIIELKTRNRLREQALNLEGLLADVVENFGLNAQEAKTLENSLFSLKEASDDFSSEAEIVVRHYAPFLKMASETQSTQMSNFTYLNLAEMKLELSRKRKSLAKQKLIPDLAIMAEDTRLQASESDFSWGLVFQFRLPWQGLSYVSEVKKTEALVQEQLQVYEKVKISEREKIKLLRRRLETSYENLLSYSDEILPLSEVYASEMRLSYVGASANDRTAYIMAEMDILDVQVQIIKLRKEVLTAYLDLVLEINPLIAGDSQSDSSAEAFENDLLDVFSVTDSHLFNELGKLSNN